MMKLLPSGGIAHGVRNVPQVQHKLEGWGLGMGLRREVAGVWGQRERRVAHARFHSFWGYLCLLPPT